MTADIVCQGGLGHDTGYLLQSIRSNGVVRKLAFKLKPIGNRDEGGVSYKSYACKRRRPLKSRPMLISNVIRRKELASWQAALH